MIRLSLILAALLASAQRRSVAGLSLEDRCTIVSRVVSDVPPDRKPLNQYDCVLNNGVQPGVVLVDGRIVSAGGEATQPLFLPGEVCPDRSIRILLAPPSLKEDEMARVLRFQLRRISRGRYRYSALLHGIDSRDPEEKSGEIGIACGAGASGTAEKRQGSWTVQPEPGFKGM